MKRIKRIILTYPDSKLIRLTSFVLICLHSGLIYSQVIMVKQDGSGDFITIQEGIDFSQYGDTVLVWPGIYYENLDFNGQSLTLASLNLTTGDPTYIYSTIIDGNHSGGCITLSSGEDLAIIHGFTIQNGRKRDDVSGVDETYGGGILAFHADSIRVINSVIKDNEVNGGGGGICILYSGCFLSNLTIKRNHAIGGGGGIMMGSGALVNFDTINRSNIYLNYSARGCDIHAPNADELAIKVILDTFTVLNPDTYYLSSIDMYGFQDGLITYNILHEKITPINGDLYVSPSGSDSNNGFSSDYALRSVSFALTKIVSDSTHPNTIHLANGIYSPSQTEEKYPLNIRNYITISGENQDSTFLDGDSVIYILKGNNEISHFTFRNLTISNGNGNIHSSSGIGLMNLYVVKDALFEHVGFTGGVGDFRSIFSIRGDQVRFENCTFYKNYGGKPRCSISERFYPPGTYLSDTNEFINCRFYNNQPSFFS
jgi:hypothetical protein